MMDARICLLLISASFASCLPSGFTPCCSPKELTFDFESVVTTQDEALPMDITIASTTGAYDFERGLYASNVNAGPPDGAWTSYKSIMNSTAGYQWVIEEGYCFKLPLRKEGTPRQCIPGGAQYINTFLVGLDNMKIHSWRIDLKDPSPLIGSQTYTVTDKKCTPLSIIFVGNEAQSSTKVVHSGYFVNITTTIKDPDNWFTLPSSCQNALNMAPSEERSRPSRQLKLWF